MSDMNEEKIDLGKITEIMKFIYLNKEKYTVEQLEEKFDKKTFNLFSQFAIGGHGEYVSFDKGKGGARLTPAGVREFYRLTRQQEDARRTQAMVFATACMAAGTIALAWATMATLQSQITPLEVLAQQIPRHILIIVSLSCAVFFGAIWQIRKWW